MRARADRIGGNVPQRGVVLILTMFVLLISIALVAQLSVGAAVAEKTTHYRSNKWRMRMAARSAAAEVEQLLVDDAAGAEGASGFGAALGAGGGAGGAGGGAGGMGVLGDAGALGAPQGGGGGQGGEGGAGGQGGGESGQGGGEGGEGEEEDGSNADSFEDAWAKPMRIVMGDIEITSFVEDENGKYHLHQLVMGDPDAREEAFERVVRILDVLREDFEDDLQETRARRIAEEMVAWMEVARRDRRVPAVPRHSLNDEDEYILMSYLEELLLLESVTPDLYYDQRRGDDRIAPGLESVFTVWTLPAFDAPQSGALGEGGDALAQGGEGGQGGQGGQGGEGGGEGGQGGQGGEGGGEGGQGNAGGGERGGGEGLPAAGTGGGAGGEPGDALAAAGPAVGMQGVLEGDPPIGTAINLNTAPRAVLEGMFPTYRLSPRQVTAILRYRNEVDEEALEERETADVDADEQELRETLFGRDEEDPKQYFASLEELAEVDGLDPERLDEELQQEMQDLFGVQSDVFSVHLYLRVRIDPEWEPERRYQEPPGQTLRLRTIVWRRSTPSGVKLVHLLPWHEVPYTRWRIPDFQRELGPFRPPRYE